MDHPILAGLTSGSSTKLISNLQQVDQDAPGASMMNSMMITMPLMSVFFCFSLPSAIGIYWVVQGAFQLVQQLIVNAHMNKIDVDDLIRRNVEKMNKKRARKGLPPANVSEKASVNLKALQHARMRKARRKRTRSPAIKSRWRRLKHFTIPIRSRAVWLPRQRWCRSTTISTRKNRRRAQDGYDYGYR